MKINNDTKILIVIWIMVIGIFVSIIMAIIDRPIVEVNNQDINSYLSSMREKGYEVVSVYKNSDEIYTITYKKLWTWSGNEIMVENKSFNP